MGFAAFLWAFQPTSINIFFNSLYSVLEFRLFFMSKSIAKDMHDVFGKYLIIRAQIFLDVAKFVKVVLLSSVKFVQC